MYLGIKDAFVHLVNVNFGLYWLLSTSLVIIFSCNCSVHFTFFRADFIQVVFLFVCFCLFVFVLCCFLDFCFFALVLRVVFNFLKAKITQTPKFS